MCTYLKPYLSYMSTLSTCFLGEPGYITDTDHSEIIDNPVSGTDGSTYSDKNTVGPDSGDTQYHSSKLGDFGTKDEL